MKKSKFKKVLCNSICAVHKYLLSFYTLLKLTTMNILRLVWRILRIPVAIIMVLIAAVLVLGLFGKKELKAEKEIVINRPKAAVYDYIKLLANQNNYSKWSAMDPAMKKTYVGTDGTVGFISGWDGNSDVGKGEQQIKKMEGDRIDYDLRFEKPFKSTSTAFMTTLAISDSTTKVIWGFEGKMNYPLNAMNVFTDMSKSIGEDYDEGLKNLKAVLDK
jgi:Polyketide cyclase / dehydrase and lipid transport